MAFPLFAIGETPPPPIQNSPIEGTAERAIPIRNPVLAERLEQSLPDDGPRQEGQSSGIDGLAWQEGQSAYRKKAWPEAQRFFGTIVKEHPESPLVPSTKAYLIEML